MTHVAITLKLTIKRANYTAETVLAGQSEVKKVSSVATL